MIQLILSVALIVLILAVPIIETHSETQEHNHVIEATEFPINTNDEQTIYSNEAIGGQWIVKPTHQYWI
jgi:hypothetical protein